MPATAYAVPVNALIEAMLNDNLAKAHHLLDAAPEGEHKLEPFEPNTFALLAQKGYHLKTKELKDAPSAINLLMSVAYFWYENHEQSEAHARLFLRIVDALYSISPAFYFDHLLIIGKLIEEKRKASSLVKKDAYHNTIKISSPVLETLENELNQRIRVKLYPINHLKLFTNSHDQPLTIKNLPGEGKLGPGSCFTKAEARILRRAEAHHDSENPEKRIPAETGLLPLLGLNQTEKATLFSAVLQCDTFNKKDADRPLNTSRLEFFHRLATSGNENSHINLMIPRSVLMRSYAYLAERLKGKIPFYLIEINSNQNIAERSPNELVDASREHLAYRFTILKKYLSHEITHQKELDIIIKYLYTIFTTEHESQLHGRKTTYVYPAWFISTALSTFNIDINRPLTEGLALIVSSFMEQSVSALKHLLSIDTIQPDDNSLKAMTAFLKKAMREAKIASPSEKANLVAEIRSKANLLAEKLDGDRLDTFNEEMTAIRVFRDKPSPIEARVLVLPKESPEQLVLHILRRTKGNPLDTWNFLIEENIHDFFNMTPTQDDLKVLKDCLISDIQGDALDKKKFSAFKKRISQFILADEARKEKIKAVLDRDPENLNEAVKENYLLYILSLGRTFLKPHTTQKHFYDKLNHFMALNAVLHDKSLPEKTLKKFGLFQTEPVYEPRKKQEPKPHQRPKRKSSI